MKVRIPAQTVDVDPEAWANEFGVDKENVRKDVQAYFEGWFQQQVEALGLGGKNATG